MEYSKLDAPLAAALAETQQAGERKLTVYIQTTHPPGVDEAQVLERLGVGGVTGGRQLFTATLAPSAIAELSDQPWVQSLRFSGRLRMLGPE